MMKTITLEAIALVDDDGNWAIGGMSGQKNQQVLIDEWALFELVDPYARRYRVRVEVAEPEETVPIVVGQASIVAET